MTNNPIDNPVGPNWAPIDTERNRVGRKLKTKLEGVRRETDKKGWTLEVQGKRVSVVLHGYRPLGEQNKTRGQIIGFSRRARARMLRRIAEINWELAGDGLFVTVTYPDECCHLTMKVRSKHRYLLNRYIEFVTAHHYGQVWRVEWKPRLSGMFVGQSHPHIHMLYFGLREFDKEEIRAKWAKIVGYSGHIQVEVEPVSVGNMAALYVAKYCGKEEVSSLLDNVPKRNKTGRHCGWLRKSLIPMHPLEKVQQLDQAIVDWLQGRAREVLWWYDPRFDTSFTILGDLAVELVQDYRRMFLDTHTRIC